MRSVETIFTQTEGSIARMGLEFQNLTGIFRTNPFHERELLASIGRNIVRIQNQAIKEQADELS